MFETVKCKILVPQVTNMATFVTSLFRSLFM